MKTAYRKAFLLLLAFKTITVHAQTDTSAAGEYYLRGQPETASGFKLNADGSFQFFFSYGALDRYGKGQWQKLSDSLVFNSGQKPEKDFKLLSAKAADGRKIVVRIKDNNTALLSHFYCRIKGGGGKQQEGTTNKEGLVTFRPQRVDTLELFFEFCPEKVSVFSPAAKGLHNFVFVPEPWLMEVFFQNFRLAVADDGLHGGHPMSDKTSFFYEKAQPSK